MMTSVRKTLKMPIWSAQDRSISNEVFPENNHKIGLFWPRGFQEVFFHRGLHVALSDYRQDWEQCRWNVQGILRHCTVRKFNVFQQMGTNAPPILFDGAYFLLAVMVEGDESSQWFWPATSPHCSPEPWPHVWTKLKSWKSWLTWAICAIFSSLPAILKEISAIVNCK